MSLFSTPSLVQYVFFNANRHPNMDIVRCGGHKQTQHNGHHHGGVKAFEKAGRMIIEQSPAQTALFTATNISEPASMRVIEQKRQQTTFRAVANESES